MSENSDNKIITKKYLDEYNTLLCREIVKMVDNQTSQSIGTMNDCKYISEDLEGVLDMHHKPVAAGEPTDIILEDDGTQTTFKKDCEFEKSISVGDSIVASNEVLRTKFKNNYIGLAGEDIAISTVNMVEAQVIERHVEAKLTMNVFQAKVDENKRIKTPAIAIGKHTDSSDTLESAICIGEINRESLGAPTYFAINYPTINTPSISGGTISEASLTGVTLDGTISGSTISGGTISGASLSGTITNGGTISGGTISGGTISNATLNDCTINNLPDIKIFNLMLKIDNTSATAIKTVAATLNYDGQTNSYSFIYNGSSWEGQYREAMEEIAECISQGYVGNVDIQYQGTGETYHIYTQMINFIYNGRKAIYINYMNQPDPNVRPDIETLKYEF